MGKKKRKLRAYIADEVSERMGYMCVCPNERDAILNIILSKKDRYAWKKHCANDCHITTCRINSEHRHEVIIPEPKRRK